MQRTLVSLEEVREDHRRLRPHIEDLRRAADAVSAQAGRDAFEFVDDSWRFLSEHLLAHAQEEEAGLYLEFTAVVGSPLSIRLMTMDHEAIEGLVYELGSLRRQAADHDTLPEELARSLRRVLYGLYALIVAHFAKEEAVVLGVLEQRKG